MKALACAGVIGFTNQRIRVYINSHQTYRLSTEFTISAIFGAKSTARVGLPGSALRIRVYKTLAVESAALKTIKLYTYHLASQPFATMMLSDSPINSIVKVCLIQDVWQA